MFGRENLATTQLNHWVYREHVLPTLKSKFGAMFPIGPGLPNGPGTPSHEDFDQVAHLLWTLLFAVAGGSISLLIWAIGQRRTTCGANDERG